MKQKQIAVKNNAPELFALANSLRKCGVTQKEAFAKAKETLSKKMLREKLMEMMKSGVVYIRFTNRKFKVEEAKATNCPSEIPNRKIGGRTTPKNDEWITFYDKIHGMSRSITLDSIEKFSESRFK